MGNFNAAKDEGWNWFVFIVYEKQMTSLRLIYIIDTFYTSIENLCKDKRNFVQIHHCFELVFFIYLFKP